MRAIKFRGKRVDNGEWVYGAFYPIKDEDVYFIINNCKSIDFDDNNTTFNGHKVHKKSVGQFTGIRDKNGKEIYEGDLVQHDAWDYPFEVIFNDEKARFVCKLKTGLTQYIDYENLVVVGDVY